MSKGVLGIAALLLSSGGALYGGYRAAGGPLSQTDAPGDAPRLRGRTAPEPPVADAAPARRAAPGADEGEGMPPDRVRTASGDPPRRRGLRGAPTPDTDGPSDAERLLADIAARADEAPDETEAGGGATRYTANARLADKPDPGGFTANRREVDKPDQGGFLASADTPRLDPCLKADGTPYVGPGTAVNPFAATDPCLPQATAQAYEVASLGDPGPGPAPVDPPGTFGPVDVDPPRLPDPPTTGTGSDYRG